ncbi:hypothetical protein NCAS_0H03290 [Naumovozyma castellii]|uniref:Elongation factor 1-gamma 1 n=1 Tax=Naumovozyma castellii TaxID=27288 RepID=G0VJG0_NAUCA|nr:hypothetical protein NCAS_0H03290 [Naumovozyma castellii CBS 4309]CCC71639.1 hypothetical protein NCAS_0H03290 [Naumovozyma castellii CBS 4309]
MAQGKLYVSRSTRSAAAEALISHFKLDFDIVQKDDCEEFATLFPLKKVPALTGPNGFKLTEALAIIYYLVDLIGDEKVKAKLVGTNTKEKAQILRWASLTNSDLASVIYKPWFLITVGPYNKREVETANATIEKLAAVYEARLKEYTYLATENISLADLQGAGQWALGFATTFGPEFRAKYPALTRWFKTVLAGPIKAPRFQDFTFPEKTLEYVAPKKEKKPKAEKKPAAEKKPEAAAEAPAEKKPKHPLDLLGRSTFVLDEWKRKYSNEDTRPVALPWFWEHYNPEEYSLWKVEYKYNDELTLTFMSNNLIGGFFNRLSASTKYMFGSMVVYGENNDNGIVGAVLVRGQDSVPAFDVAPDWESYSYTKLDPTKEEDKEFVNNMWAWDKPVNGKEIVDGKVLK